MKIQTKKAGNKGVFYVEKDKKIVAEMIYNMPSANKMIIEHTEVSQELEGQGAGGQLVHEAVEYARANNIKIIPLCSFASSVFEKKPEYADVLVNRI